MHGQSSSQALGVHLVPQASGDRRALFEAIRRALPRWDCGVALIGGDFSVVEGEGGFNISDGTIVNSFGPKEPLFSEVFESRLTALSQLDFTPLGIWNGFPHITSRIDRWYSTVDVPSFIDCVARLGIVWPPKVDNGVSDHAPVFGYSWSGSSATSDGHEVGSGGRQLGGSLALTSCVASSSRWLGRPSSAVFCRR